MRLHTIVIVLALLTCLSTSVGGYFYYSSLKKSVIRDAYGESLVHSDLIQARLSGLLNGHRKAVKALAEVEGLRKALLNRDEESLEKANTVLEHFHDALDVDVCYLMDDKGNTLASSNRLRPDSFVGKNYSFRPYFQRAMQGSPHVYSAVGVTSKKRGLYFSHPVFGVNKAKPVGAVVMKVLVEPVEEEFRRSTQGIVLLTDPHDTVFLSTREEWLYLGLWRKPLARVSNHFPPPLVLFDAPNAERVVTGWTGLRKTTGHQVQDAMGNDYLISQQKIESYPGWHIVHLSSLNILSKKVSQPLIDATAYIIITWCFLVGVAVFYLYRQARRDIRCRIIAEEALKQSEEKYRMIFQNSPVGILHFDHSGVVTACNDSLLKVCADRRENSVGFNLLRSLKDEGLKAAISRCVSGKPSRYEGFYRSLVSNKMVAINAVFSPLVSGDGLCAGGIGIVQDISDRKRAEEALRKSEARYRAIVEDQTELISRFSPDGILRFVNDAYCRYFGETREQLVGARFWHHVPEEDAERLKQHIASLSESRPVAVIEHRVLRPNGQMCWQQWSDRAIFDGRGSIVEIQAVGRDITELKRKEETLRQSEKQLRSLSSRLLTAQEEERRKFAAELHDSVGSSLSAIKFGLENTLGEPQVKECLVAVQSLETLVSLTQRTVDECRRIMSGLRPSMLDDVGIIATINWFCREHEKVYSCIRIEKQVTAQEELIPSSIKIVIFRVMQEAFHNIVKYSKADLVRLALIHADGRIALTIMDNGTGFSMESVLSRNTQENGLGLASMKERTELSGGIFEIETALNKGTTIRASWPSV